MHSQLDPTDWQILSELQADARLSYAELGRRVGLSSPAVQERVRKLEDMGIIEGYKAVINTESMGLGIMAYVKVGGSCRVIDEFVEFTETVPEIMECHVLLGDDCFLLRVVAESIAHLEDILLKLKHYGETATSVVLNSPLLSRPVTPENFKQEA